MKVICTQENLNHGLNVVSQIAYKNTTLPILNNVLIESKNGVISLSTTNLEIAIQCIVRGKVEEDDSVTVNAKLLSEYVNLLPRDKINMETKENVLQVQCQNFATKINGHAADDFPLIPKIEKTNVLSCNARDFKRALQQVIFAASSDDHRPEIHGVLFKFQQNTLTLVATDSFRLAEKKVTLDQTVEQDMSIIIPVYTVQQLLRIVSDVDKDTSSEHPIVEFDIADSQIAIQYDNVHVISRLVSGQYPDYEQMIPKEFKTTFTLNKSELLQVIKNVSLFCRLGINDIHLTFNPETNDISIRADNSELGENVGKIIGEGSGDVNELVFNYKYMLEGLNTIADDRIQLQVIDSMNPGLITSAGDSAYRYIVMPIRN